MTEPARLLPALELSELTSTTPTGHPVHGASFAGGAASWPRDIAATYLALAASMATLRGAGGWTLVDDVLFACFLVAAALDGAGLLERGVGLWLLHGAQGRRRRRSRPSPPRAERSDPIHAAHRRC